MKTLVELVERRAEQHGDKRLFTFLADGETREEHMSFVELRTKARTIGAELQRLGAAGERALLLYPPGLDYVAAFFGCLYAGVIAVPAYPPNPAALDRTLPRLLAIAADARASIIMTTSPLKMLAAGVLGADQPFKWVTTDGLDAGLAASWTAPAPTSLAFLQYTSGSTDAPKGVMVSHANLLHNSKLIGEAFGHSSSSLGIIWLPPYHDMGLIGGIIQPLYIGGCSVLMSPLHFLQRPVRWLQAISRYRGTTSGGPNFAFELCVRKTTPEQRAALDLSSWQCAFNGAEPIRRETLARFADAFAPAGFRPEAMYPCYGLAEATLIATGGALAATPITHRFDTRALGQRRVVPVDTGGTALVACGRPIGASGGELAIVDPDTLRTCAPNQIGEIWLASASVAGGYYRREEDTGHTFRATLADGGGSFLRTGDLGFVHDGELYVAGRRKDLIIIRGHNHYPQDIEHTVESTHIALRPGCGAAFAIDVDGEERLVITYEIDPAHVAEADAIVEGVRRAVADVHELSAHAIVLVEQRSIPKTSSGKIQRHACRNAYLANELTSIKTWSAPIVAAVTAPAVERSSLVRWIVERVAEVTGVHSDRIDPTLAFAQFGMSSLQIVSLTGELETHLDRRLAPTLAYEYPTIDQLARHLSGESAPAIEPARSIATTEPIAIVGIGCRFPSADGPDAFWRLLRDGIDAIGERGGRPGGYLDAIDQFDPDLFHISQREADAMDPQQRLLLEVAWRALEDAGLPAPELRGTTTGVFVGISTSDYARTNPSGDIFAITGNALSIAANRISYAFDLRGPSLAVDTACSSSLVAIHLACRSLRAGESTLALAGGANLVLSGDLTATLASAGFLAPDGRCKTFDARANGYVRGEGAGVVVLKTLSRAVADGDRIYAVICGTAVNSDGRSNGLTAPNLAAQQAVLRAAYADAQVDAAAVEYIEAHGTGTALGDPIEARALSTVVHRSGPPCRVGSVKTNIGHLEAAAGIAGVIKTALSLHHRELPPSLHFETANPAIPFEQLGLAVQTARSSWQGGVAGVSSFGFGGTNAHAVLAPAPSTTPTRAKLPPRPFAHRRCWIDAPVHAAASVVDGAGHPLLGRALPLAEGHAWATTIDTKRLPYLADHRFEDAAIVPATAMLELALAAALEVGGAGLDDVELRRPLVVDERSREMQVSVGVDDRGRERVRIFSRADGNEGEWRLHATGTIGAAGVDAPRRIDFAEIRSRCRETVSLSKFRDAMARRGLSYGPTFQGLSEIQRSTTEALARVTLPAGLDGRYHLHPALLDACAQLVGALDPTGKPFMPIGAAHVRWLRPAPATVWSWMRGAGTNAAAGGPTTFDLVIADEAGDVIAEIDGLNIQHLDDANRRIPPERMLYDVRWQRQPLRGLPIAREPGTWFVLADRAASVATSAVGGAPVERSGERSVIGRTSHELVVADRAATGSVASALIERLGASGDRCTTVHTPDELARALDELRETPLRGVVHLWSLDVSAPATTRELEAAHARIIDSALAVIQRANAKLWLVTRGAQPVAESSASAGSGAVATIPAMMWGLGRTLAQERGDLLGGLIDLAPGGSTTDAAGTLVRELTSGDGEQQIAYRDARYVARLERTSDIARTNRGELERTSDIARTNRGELEHTSGMARASRGELACHADGTYLVTGGLGGIGLVVARALADRGARRIILMARTALPARSEWSTALPPRVAVQVNAVRELEARGVAVHLAAVDVGDEAQLRAYLDAFRREAWPAIRGVVHLAGVLADRTLAKLEPALLADVFRAKVTGGWLLDRLVTEPLDFFVAFSSMAAVLGSAGQASYAAANAFLDALAHDRRRRGLPALSIDWGPWADVGVATAVGRGDRLSRGGIASIEPDTGADMFVRLAASAATQVTAMAIDWAQLAKSFPAAARAPFFEHVIAAAAPAKAPAKTALELPALIAMLSAEIARAIGATAPVAADVTLDRLGIDSLIGIELREKLETDLGIEIPIGTLLAGPTITQLATTIVELAASPKVASTTSTRAATVTAIQPRGDKPALYCIHPGALETGCYDALARELGDSRPLYCIRLPELDASYALDDAPADGASVAALAQRCVEGLKTRQPEGPYFLGGWSLGGVLAFEVVRQLEARGDRVGALVMFDSPSAGRAQISEDDPSLVNAFASYLGMRQGTAFQGEVGDGDRDRRLANVLVWAKANGLLPAAAELAQIRSLLATYTRGLRTSTERLLDYAPGPVRAPVAYFRAATSLVAYRRAFVDGAAWWREHTTVFEPIDVPGDHYSMFLAPNVAALSAQLERVLAW